MAKSKPKKPANLAGRATVTEIKPRRQRVLVINGRGKKRLEWREAA